MLFSALIYLAAAVLSVPIAKRLGLGSVLGYLLAGMLIGPYALHLVGDQTDVMHFAEFGVVMMLFLVGLELQPSRLWQMRRPIIGLGGLQVVLTTLLIAALMLLSPYSWQSGIAIGLCLALSSTAIVLQSLSERGLLNSQAGNNAFAVLLFQDIAVIPILALLPLLALNGASADAVNVHPTPIDGLPVWAQVGVTALIIAAIILGGKFLSAPIFRIIAETRLRELFTAFSLLIVIAIAVLMQAVGLSPALGTFLAGVVLAESEFRHELEVDIEPFKGLLLGLFFITVGASIDFPLLAAEPLLIGAAVLALFAVKALVLALLARLFTMPFRQGLLFTVALAQGGEFAFVLVSSAKQFQVFDIELGNLITLIVALSMLISPLLIVAYEKLLSRPGQQAKSDEADQFSEHSDVIIAGYGRFGQIVGRLLSAQGFRLTILDHSPSQIDLVRRFGNKVYYGDAARHDLLQAAGAAEAKLLVIAVDEPDKTLEIIHTAQQHFPHLKILARAIDRRHAYQIMRYQIDGIRRETFDSALHVGVQSLKLLGVNENDAERAGELFSEHDHQSLQVLAEIWGDDRSYGVAVKQRLEDLKQVLLNDQQQRQKAEKKRA
ncbi:monovalent cation:proton antiporter-2 (CPA2) family protein [Permianibacter aggregans]|uniref:Kef-type potassium/proton antiporter (CPA2 family) n=1 Tax=Permianibacter aggregans TaxID=1510150 RepID=A0A4R6UKL7_9GAMM|nr:monovalent cation:proton antiporter-2 (CPA2) family protein [Permianibacter aggregans]QGX39738.1 potassium transporter [Permianibacter aggregans]TDQ47142.1 Kef-type potassium/proton antiporter (CPA2 family) [Permianibacter aggregans]